MLIFKLISTGLRCVLFTKWTCLCLLVCWWHGKAQAQTDPPGDFRYFYAEGQKACEQQQYQACLDNFSKSNQLRPGHQIIMYQLARAYAFNDQIDSTEHYLSKALAIKADFNLADSAFRKWQNSPQFDQLRTVQTELLAPVHKSSTVSVLEKRDLHLESLAYDPKSNRLFAGSVRHRQILWCHPGDSSWQEFTAIAEDGLGSVFGMKVDLQRRLLWVCTVNTPFMVNADSNALEISAIHKYHLDTEKLLQRYQADGSPHWFGDLTLNGNGDVYISDSRANAIYRITVEKDSLELYLRSDQFLSLQGLDFDDQDRYLYVSDYVLGPFKVDMDRGTSTSIACSVPNTSLKSIDGLYYYQNSLIATQNQVMPMRVTRFYLDNSGSRVVSVKYLEKSNPLLNEPTLGVVIGEEFYYVANSQWGGYDRQNQPLPEDQLQDIHIMKVGL